MADNPKALKRESPMMMKESASQIPVFPEPKPEPNPIDATGNQDPRNGIGMKQTTSNIKRKWKKTQPKLVEPKGGKKFVPNVNKNKSSVLPSHQVSNMENILQCLELPEDKKKSLQENLTEVTGFLTGKTGSYNPDDFGKGDPITLTKYKVYAFDTASPKSLYFYDPEHTTNQPLKQLSWTQRRFWINKLNNIEHKSKKKKTPINYGKKVAQTKRPSDEWIANEEAKRAADAYRNDGFETVELDDEPRQSESVSKNEGEPSVLPDFEISCGDDMCGED